MSLSLSLSLSPPIRKKHALLCQAAEDLSLSLSLHNTNTTLLLLFADAFIAPALLAGLFEVDELILSLFHLIQALCAGSEPRI